MACYRWQNLLVNALHHNKKPKLMMNLTWIILFVSFNNTLLYQQKILSIGIQSQYNTTKIMCDDAYAYVIRSNQYHWWSYNCTHYKNNFFILTFMTKFIEMRKLLIWKMVCCFIDAFSKWKFCFCSAVTTMYDTKFFIITCNIFYTSLLTMIFSVNITVSSTKLITSRSALLYWPHNTCSSPW